jgi:hypothetical protein
MADTSTIDIDINVIGEEKVEALAKEIRDIRGDVEFLNRTGIKLKSGGGSSQQSGNIFSGATPSSSSSDRDLERRYKNEHRDICVRS